MKYALLIQHDDGSQVGYGPMNGPAVDAAYQCAVESAVGSVARVYIIPLFAASRMASDLRERTPA